MGNAMAFPNFAPIHCIVKIANNFVCGAAFENQMLSVEEIDDSFFW
jgi:hypothetical protein